MSKRLAFIIIVSILLVDAFPSCKKDEVSSALAFDSFIMDYLVFKPGSYWIYQEVNSGVQDSIALVSQQIVKKKLNDNADYYELTQEKYSSQIGRTVCKTLLRQYHNQYYYLYVENNESQYFNKLPLGTVIEEDKPLTYYYFYSKYKLGLTEYQNVREFDVDPGGFNSKVSRAYYVAKIGLVQKGNAETTLINLVKYKVSQ